MIEGNDPFFDEMMRVLCKRVDEAKTAQEAINAFSNILVEERAQSADMLESLKNKLAKLNAENHSDPQTTLLEAQIAIIEPSVEKMIYYIEKLAHVASLINT